MVKTVGPPCYARAASASDPSAALPRSRGARTPAGAARPGASIGESLPATPPVSSSRRAWTVRVKRLAIRSQEKSLGNKREVGRFCQLRAKSTGSIRESLSVKSYWIACWTPSLRVKSPTVTIHSCRSCPVNAESSSSSEINTNSCRNTFPRVRWSGSLRG